MRISDWSSDVCSSDLPPPPRTPPSTRIDPLPLPILGRIILAINRYLYISEDHISWRIGLRAGRTCKRPYPNAFTVSEKDNDEICHSRSCGGPLAGRKPCEYARCDHAIRGRGGARGHLP